MRAGGSLCIPSKLQDAAGLGNQPLHFVPRSSQSPPIWNSSSWFLSFMPPQFQRCQVSHSAGGSSLGSVGYFLITRLSSCCLGRNVPGQSCAWLSASEGTGCQRFTPLDHVTLDISARFLRHKNHQGPLIINYYFVGKYF